RRCYHPRTYAHIPLSGLDVCPRSVRQRTPERSLIRSWSCVTMTNPIAADLLVFGPHPDDIELGLGATIAKHVDEGYRVALVDLTAAELSSNGSPEQRHREAAE